MLIFLSSDNIVLVAMFAGLLCAVCSSAIDDFFRATVFQQTLINHKKLIKKYVISGCFGSFFLGLIFYAFTNTETRPIQMIFTYAFILGMGAPILSNLVIFTYSKLFSSNQNS